MYFSWDTSYKVVDNPDGTLWFAYVHLNGWPETPDQWPDVFFVPSRVVIEHMRKEQKPDASRTFFWMYESDASGYRGVAGLEAMKLAMK